MFSLTYLDRFKIKNKKLGLTEPSGLALSPDGSGLWTVSDDTNRVFRLSLDGKLKRGRTFKVPDTELEGITAEPTGRYLFVVRETSNEIIKLDIAGRAVADRHRLADMDGYDAIADFFAGDDENMGLEGITWNSDSETLFALKEGDPGLLIEIGPDLRAVLGHAVLDTGNGFVDDEVRGDRVDYSGICYDPSRKSFWIVSDRARRVFLYDPAANRVVQSAALGYCRNGKYKQVKKAEGVAYDPESNRLYIVSDKEVRLYVFDVRF